MIQQNKMTPLQHTNTEIAQLERDTPQDRALVGDGKSQVSVVDSVNTCTQAGG